MFLQHPRLPVDLLLRPNLSDPNSSDTLEFTDLISDLRKRAVYVHQLASKASKKGKSRQKETYDSRPSVQDQPFEIGDRVLVRKTGVLGRNKLGDRWEPCPYIVLKRRPSSPVYTIQQEGSGVEKTVHRNMLTQCMFLPLEEDADNVVDSQQDQAPESQVPESIEEEPAEQDEERDDVVLDEDESLSSEEEESEEDDNAGCEDDEDGDMESEGATGRKQYPRRNRQPPCNVWFL